MPKFLSNDEFLKLQHDLKKATREAAAARSLQKQWFAACQAAEAEVALLRQQLAEKARALSALQVACEEKLQAMRQSIVRARTDAHHARERSKRLKRQLASVMGEADTGGHSVSKGYWPSEEEERDLGAFVRLEG